MDAKDCKYAELQLRDKTENRRSIFDFSSVEDLRRPDDNQDSDPVKIQPTIPFKESYIAHAPSRHSFTLNSRYTFFGGLRTSSKDMSASTEDLAGCKERHLSLGKFSKSSPDLFGASYQSTRADAGIKQQTQDTFVMNIDIETDDENENGGSMKHEKTKLENDTLRTQTEHEASPHLSFTAFQNTKRDLSFDDDDDSETAHVQHPGTNDDDSLSIEGTSESIEKKRNVFDKGWKTILCSGKAELKKSLENLSSLKQDMSSREIQNIETFEDSVALEEDEVSLEQVRDLVNGRGYGTGDKKKDETTDLNFEKPKKNLPNFEEEISYIKEGDIGIWVPNTAENILRIIESSEDSKWTTLDMDKTDGTGNTLHAATTQEETANENEEKQAALACINDSEHSSTSEEELTGVHEQFHTNYRDAATSEVQENKEGLITNHNIESTANDSQVDGTNCGGIMVDNEGYSSHSCNISPITLRVLSNSTARDENTARQNTNLYKRGCDDNTVKVSGIRQSSICVRGEYQREVERVETHEPNRNDQNENTDEDDARKLETSQEKTDNSLLKNMMGMFCLLGLKDSPEGGFYGNGQRELRSLKNPINFEQEICADAEIHEQTKKNDVDLHENIERKLFTRIENETMLEANEDSEENDPVLDLSWEKNGAEDAKLGIDNNTTKTQLMMDDESPTIIEEINSDVFEHEALLENKSSVCDKEFLLNQDSDTAALYEAGIQNGKDKNFVEYRNTQEDTDQGIILETTSTLDLLLQVPDDSGENSDSIVQNTEGMVEQGLRENDETDEEKQRLIKRKNL
ncbi:uncharacterized protein LOC114525567 [Dendronephthya gigantea]|uniref:uncharacterized protein LOC114525567 n=1 Tax=Dendronephthya gigantea TaxID=151771 RepID=UPI00106DACDD|nr:uncharacterized protein LOC114525567 [Dendronephthya gigantea]